MDWSTKPTVRFCGADGGSANNNKLTLITVGKDLFLNVSLM